MVAIVLVSPSAYGQYNIEYEFPSQIYDNAESITIRFKNINPGLSNKIWVSGTRPYPDYESGVLTPQEISGSSPKAYFVEKTITRSEAPGAFFLYLGKDPSYHEVVLKFNGNRFDTPGYTVIPHEIQSCDYFSVVPSIFDLSQLDTTKIKASGLTPGEYYGISIYDSDGNHVRTQAGLRPDGNGDITIRMSQLLNTSSPIGRYEARLVYQGDFICRAGFELQTYIPPDVTPSPGVTPTPGEYDPCAGAKDKALASCQRCLGWDGTNYTLLAKKSWTALGCIPTDPRDFVAWLLARAIGIGGGIAFLLMIWGGFQVITAAGDPDRLNAGKEVITSAIAGLLLIIFSLFLLELIGVDILGLKEVGFEFGGG